MLKTEELKLVSEWDKTFPQSEKVDHTKVTFVNRYGITLAADLYKPKNAFGKYPAIAVSGPFGAVKEQCSGLYAQTMAEKGYLTIAFDPSFTGESGGNPRYMASPDINTEDFMAAVDFLSVREEVDQDRIGIIGICGWGGMALNAAALDTRIKATVASTMYDMTRVNANGYFDSEDSEEARYAKKQSLNTLRTQEYCKGEYSRAGGCVSLPVPEDAPFFVKDYSEYYKGRCYHKRSLNSNDGWNSIGCMSFMNQPILKYSNEIRSAVLIVHGEKAHSYYFGKDAYENMIKDSKYTSNKELLTIPGAVHTDLYDNLDVIPFDKIQKFFEENDIHIHVPEGAVPKDGPSAGITMATAILSAVAKIPVKCSVAMTGEINLRGNVMPIGGLKEKLLAAKNAGIKMVLVPKKNKPDVEEISKEITDGLEIVFVEKMEQVLENALVEQEQK